VRKKAMEIILKKMEDIMCDPSNVRSHSKKNIEVIKSSLAKFGQQKPIVISSDNVIIAGNGTYEAAKILGWDIIRCVTSDLDASCQVAFAIADNRTAELADWDFDKPGGQLAALQLDDFDIAAIGFDATDLASILNENDKDDFKSDLSDDDDDFTPNLPDENQENNTDKKLSLIVLFDSEESQEELFIELRDRGYRVKV